MGGIKDEEMGCEYSGRNWRMNSKKENDAGGGE